MSDRASAPRSTLPPLSFTVKEWYLLPLTFRKRWWSETNYGNKSPSKELLAEGQRLLAEAHGTES